MLKTNRSLLKDIVFTILTCGIYHYWFIHSVARDVNTACEGDGDKVGGLAAFIILNYLTCGIYGIYWNYKIANRIQNTALNKYGVHIPENGTNVLLWILIGSWLCGIGYFVAMHIIIKNTNLICGLYNNNLGRRNN